MSSRKSAARPSAAPHPNMTADAILLGGDDYSRLLMYRYFQNLVRAVKPQSPLAYKICETIESEIIFIDDIPDFGSGEKDEKKRHYKSKKRPPANAVKPDDWTMLTDFLDRSVETLKNSEPTIAYKNIETVGEKLHLSETDKQALLFSLVCENVSELEDFSDHFTNHEKEKVGALLSYFTGDPQKSGNFSKVFTPESTLARYGFIDPEEWQDNGEIFPSIDASYRALLNTEGLDHGRIVEDMIGKPTTAKLATTDFPYLSDDIERIRVILKNAVEKKIKGVNILLHGPAGSGKTELAKALAAELGLPLYAIGEQSIELEDPSMPQRTDHKRVSRLLQAHALLKDSGNTILLFDEIEDLLIKGNDTEKKSDTFSKITINRLLEDNDVPTIWCGNDLDKLHESIRQRFSFSLQMGYPPTKMRIEIWNRQLVNHGVDLSKEDVIGLARTYEAPPRMIANAVRMAALAENTTLDNIKSILESSSQITYGDSYAIRTGETISPKFNLALINYDRAHQNEMATLIDSGTQVGPYSLMLKGPAGAGLNSFSRFLAEKAILNPSEHDMRNIIVDNPNAPPEKKLMALFERARDQRTFLVFSHIDALSPAPLSASGGWRDGLAPLFTKLVMDHPLPVIAHSYRPDVTFPSFVRSNFAINLDIKPLTGEQAKTAFKTYFGEVEGMDDVRLPTNLVPADFAQAARLKGKIATNHFSATRLAELLKKQIDHRTEDQKGTIGIRPS